MMNTTMAPMTQERHISTEELQRRHDSLHEPPVRRRDQKKAAGKNKRDGGVGGDGSGGDPDSNGNGDSDGKGAGDGDDNNGSYNKGNSDNDNDNKKTNTAYSTLDNPPFPSSSPTKVLTTSATTVIVVSTTTAPAPAALTTSASSPVSATSTTPTGTFVSPSFPTTTPLSVDPPFSLPSAAETSSQPRKGLYTDGDPDFSTSASTSTSMSTSKSQKSPTTITVYSTATPETALGSASTSLAMPESGDSDVHHKMSDGLSPLAEQLLIAAGAIGAFIMIAAVIYFFTRVMKINIRSHFRSRRFSRGEARGWYGWRKQETDYPSDPPPSYPGGGYPSDEKAIPAQRSLDAFFSPVARLPLATPAGAAALASADPQRQEMVRTALLDNPAPFEMLPAAQPGTISASQNFYNISPQISNLSRQPGTQFSLPSQTISIYNNTGTQNTFLTRQTSGAYDPNQREVNHLSYLSSLSSGFGDGLIIPESTVNGASQQGYRQSHSQGAARFSWVASVQDRDTVYTQASIESAPRFRTVNSWVAQQSNRVEREQQNDGEVPAMPSIPLPLQAGAEHHRKLSEDLAFRAHPGDEITISRGSRVPSEILDKKIGLK